MSLIRSASQKIWDKLIIASTVLFVLLPTSPLNMLLTTRDSGVFLYIGWRILQGEVPYRDIWDHKPPIVFYINALGLALSGNSRWGVWFIEFICVFLAAYIGFRLLRRNFGVAPAIICLFFWLGSFLEMNAGGNFTETYALLLQFMCLWLVWEIRQRKYSRLHWILLGVVGAIAFFTKQTTVGIIFAAILYFSYVRVRAGRVKQWFLELLSLLFGCLLVCGGVALFFYFQGALPQFWDAAFKFNFVYVAEGSIFPDRLNAVYGLVKLAYLTRTGLFYFSALGLILGLVHYRSYNTRPWLPLLTIALFDLPIEWLLISTSGIFEAHYYITLLPVLSLFAGIALCEIISGLQTLRISKGVINAFLIGSITVFLCLSFGSYESYRITLANIGNEALKSYIEETTSSGDSILMWGAESYMNFFTNRKSPSRFVYQYPLYTRGYVDEDMILEFLHAIIQNPPELIVDTQNSATPLYHFPIETEDISRDVQYIKSHYQREGSFENWIVYRRTKDGP